MYYAMPCSLVMHSQPSCPLYLQHQQHLLDPWRCVPLQTVQSLTDGGFEEDMVTEAQ